MKKFLALLITAILFTCSVQTAFAADSSVTYGDVNKDKKINMLDVVQLQKYIASLVKLDKTALQAADVTGDGKVNMVDVTTIQKYIAKLIEKFPAEDNSGVNHPINSDIDSDGWTEQIIKP